MKLVVIESPFADPTTDEAAANVRYARVAIVDALARGEAPIASHLLYTQPGILDDNEPSQRRRGIGAGYAWADRADVVGIELDPEHVKIIEARIAHEPTRLATKVTL